MNDSTSPECAVIVLDADDLDAGAEHIEALIPQLPGLAAMFGAEMPPEAWAALPTVQSAVASVIAHLRRGSTVSLRVHPPGVGGRSRVLATLRARARGE